MAYLCLYIHENPDMLNDGIFEAKPLYGMKGDGYLYKALKEHLNALGHKISTQDIISPDDADFTIYLDRVPEKIIKNKSFLIVTEPPVYLGEAWNFDDHNKFSKVFIHDSKYAQAHPDLYRHLFYAIDTEGIVDMPIPSEEEFNSRKFASLMNGSIANPKFHRYEGSLLGERYSIIKWFSKNHPNELDFFGRGIKNKYYGMSFTGLGILQKFLPKNIIRSISKVLQKDIIRVYKGEIPALDKSLVLNKYRFNFCLENTNNINGYLTEKLFDCFYSKTIPIYWGAPNISNLLSTNLFIDYRKFNSLDELYKYMHSFSYSDALKMFKAQQEFLNSPKSENFKVAKFVQTITSELPVF